MPELIHCRVKGCNKAIHAKNFEDGMARLRKSAHPTLFRKSVKKSIATHRANKG